MQQSSNTYIDHVPDVSGFPNALAHQPVQGSKLILVCSTVGQNQRSTFLSGSQLLFSAEVLGWISGSSSHIATQQSTYSSDGAWNWSSMSPSWRTSFVGSGFKALLGGHVNERNCFLDFHPGWWAASGHLALLEPVGWDCAASWPSSSSALCPFWKPHRKRS